MLPHLHHFHLRRRVRLKKDPYPHPEKWIRRLDNLVLFCGILGPVVSLPQVYRLYSLQNATGLSLLSWSLFMIFDVPWIIYGLVHKAKPVMVAYVGWFLVNLAMVAGILLYSKDGLF